MSNTESVSLLASFPLIGSGRRTKSLLRVMADVCDAAAAGDLERRVLGCSADGDLGRMAKSINHLLDVTDAFVREARASLEHASEGKFYRRVLERGLPGTFGGTAGVINQATERMGEQAAALARTASERGALANEFEDRIRLVVSTVAASATEMQATAATLVDTAKTTSMRAATVSAAAEETAASVEAVACATEELGTTASEISRQVNDSTQTSSAAVAEVERAESVDGFHS